MFKVNDLLSANIKNEYEDKIFWFAESVILLDGLLTIHINNMNGLVAFDSVAERVGCTKISNLITEGNSQEWFKGNCPVLVSSGSFLWINDRLLLTQRTAHTPFDPLSWTTPAGRCDRTPLVTALKETLEEVIIVSQKSSKRLVPDICEYLSIDLNIDTKKIESKIGFPDFLQKKLTRVETYLDGKLIEYAELWFMYDEYVNTLELRLPILLYITDELLLSNPEFHTSTSLLDKDEILVLKLVPAVKKLFD